MTGDTETKLELKGEGGGEKTMPSVHFGNGMSAEGRNFKAARFCSTIDLKSSLFCNLWMVAGRDIQSSEAWKKKELDNLLLRNMGNNSCSDLRRERPVLDDEVGGTYFSNQLGGWIFDW